MPGGDTDVTFALAGSPEISGGPTTTVRASKSRMIASSISQPYL